MEDCNTNLRCYAHLSYKTSLQLAITLSVSSGGVR